jgi:hypothetical protein
MDRNYLVAAFLSMCGEYEHEGNYVDWKSVWDAVETIKTTSNITFDIGKDGKAIINYLERM